MGRLTLEGIHIPSGVGKPRDLDTSVRTACHGALQSPYPAVISSLGCILDALSLMSTLVGNHTVDF